ncbi:DsbC family protein [Caldimonas thermodepolymerans]|jgi:thiol:disulfide interchange protein DsbC|uniref:Thiol:disulfide interchange protein n=1 Tax=Caldimonas thermodepolymerans TaxID=215580 RepID=A0A2S5T8S1_9BURK|nr:DsbC family protein [Caldimonas thermodepolymerans]PPE71257.1 disulfide isomerase [Caldimonas thermodepolymerans]QPC32431.1 DsbC family protein [Caldimonas thermodepolymerans]RDH98818.1 thiol:disulfide interchange protein DsbC [Caldimonas thermodepolymerans]TCP06216.1 thiol:disulfide interchange protein DsbC [Caldimonas thermodepolymerans]UZG45227.1 DsbC family protein [Caldimonas thermodepolymerans]
MKHHKVAAAAVTLALAAGAWAQEAAIRRNLADRMPNLPAIDEVSKTPIPGIYEVRIGTELAYTDAEGNYLITGQIIDLKARRNLTEERQAKFKLAPIDFASLPLKDAIVWKNGNGKRKIAVFADPNCGYCKRFEQDLQAVRDVTVYTFLYPILSPDSTVKSQAIWCAKDRTRAWRDWMLNGVAPAAAPANCDTPLARNTAFGRKHGINGTPALIFEDGTRVPGALNTEQIEAQLAEVRVR